MYRTLTSKRSTSIVLLLGLFLVATAVISNKVQGQERSSRELTSIPDEWPNGLEPTNLSNIGGKFSTEVYPEGTEYSIDIWGAYDGSGRDYLATYHEVLVAAGFEQVDTHEGSDVINSSYQRGSEKLTVGFDVVNKGASSEYNEISFVYYNAVPTAK